MRMRKRKCFLLIRARKCAKRLFIRAKKCIFAQIIRAKKCDMERNILAQLIDWQHKTSRKPLILNGARQVGKTYILREFGRTQYKSTAYINCDNNDVVTKIFSRDYDIRRILLSLSAVTHVNIKPGETLIILDEIQENPLALNSLKYFCENAPEYHVAVAGSLLGISLHGDTSFPVGKVDVLKMYPMTFDEFLLAIGEKQLVDLLRSRDFSLIDTFADKLTDFLRQYYFTGGMPAVVSEFVRSHDSHKKRNIQRQILFGYRRDFSKHAPANQVPRINQVWDSIPSQLAKDNKKFIYGAIKKGARASEFELAIQWLIDAGLVYRVNRVTTPSLPLKFYEDFSAFKLFTLDVGLMGAMADTPPENILVGDSCFSEYKGAFSELFVLTQMMPRNIPVYYYSANDSRVELDFIIQKGSEIIPVEVKAEVNVRSKSLRVYIDKHPELKGLRLSMLPYKDQGWMVNVPLYAVSF